MITARKAGLVPVCIFWDDERHPVDMPPSKELRFEPGTTIGGIVQDESGQPIAGARVDVMGPPTECESHEPRASRSGPPRRMPRADGGWTSRRRT